MADVVIEPQIKEIYQNSLVVIRFLAKTNIITYMRSTFLFL